MGRCTGHCCRKFPLPGGVTPATYVERLRTVKDGPYIADMLIHIGPMEGREPDNVGAYEERHYWTCRHHNAETGDCMAYESRPAMCYEYPYGNPCEIKGCTADKPDVPMGRFNLKSLGIR